VSELAVVYYKLCYHLFLFLSIAKLSRKRYNFNITITHNSLNFVVCCVVCVLCFTMFNFSQKIRIVWIIALMLAVFILVWLKIVPSGKITYFWNSDFISKLSPAERMNGNKIIGDPVYFSLRVPRRFEKAKLTVKFKNNLPTLQGGIKGGREVISILEAGLLMDKKVWNYDLKPLDNSILDNLINKWNSVRSGDLLLLQREKKFSSVEDFLKSPLLYKEGQGEVLPADKIAAYNYSLKQEFLLPNYKATTIPKTLCRPIQGAYQFYTYIKDEDLSFDFQFQDLNKNDDSDQVDAIVYYGGEEIYKDTLPDDGGARRNLKLFLANLPEGVYKISLRANNDIITRTITTPQSKITFINKVVLADTPEVSCGRNLFTNSRTLQFQTVLSDRLGQIKIIPWKTTPNLSLGGGGGVVIPPLPEGGQGGVGDIKVAISETYKQFSTKEILPAFSEVVMPADGITVSGDGLFSFSPDQFFNPEIKKVDENFDADREGVDFIIAKYTPPAPEGEWFEASADFDLTNAYKENNKHSFLISIPGLRAEDKTLNGVEVGEIKIELEGVSFFAKLRKIFNF
jgi:hypothetical protein